jgi:hypothetical protein
VNAGEARGNQELDVEAAIDKAPLSFYQIAIAVVCSLVIMLDDALTLFGIIVLI